MDIELKIPVKSEKTASRIIEGEAVVILLDKQEAIVLNEVGSRIWEFLDGENNIDKLSHKICSEYDTSYEQALKDISAIIDDLTQKGAVVIK